MTRFSDNTLQRVTIVSGVMVAFLVAGWLTISSEVAAQPVKAAVMAPAQGLKWAKNENGVSFAYVWRSASGGPHGDLVTFPAGFSSPVHIHTADYHGVVITGTLMNPMGDAETGPELGPGSYYFVPGGQKHVTKCVSKTDCIFYIHQDAAFDFIPVK